MKTLCVIPTPIGNMQDVSDHVRQALGQVEVLFCESISHTRKLYQLLDIPLPKLVRYWQKTEQEVVDSLSQLTESQFGLVTDAGMPCISDPGYRLVSAWHERSWLVRVIPGPSALVVAVALSGIAAESFQFLGFLPPKSKACQSRLSVLKDSGMAGVLYESPHRIERLCSDICAVYGDSHLICVMRELSKKFESYYQGPAAQVVQDLKSSVVKGEFCVVISKAEVLPSWQKDAGILRSYLSVADAANACAKIHSVSKSSVYRYLLEQEGS